MWVSGHTGIKKKNETVDQQVNNDTNNSETTQTQESTYNDMKNT